MTKIAGSTNIIKGSNKVSFRHWKDVNNHKIFFQNIAKELNVHQTEDWFRVIKNDFRKRGALVLLNKYYRGSLHKALEVAYPDYQKIIRNFFDKLSKQFNIDNPTQWYDFDLEIIKNNGGKDIIKHFGGSLTRTLSFAYPEIQWKNSKVSSCHWNNLENHRKFF